MPCIAEIRGVVGQALSLPAGGGQFLVKRFDDPFFFDVKLSSAACTDPGDNFFKDWNANVFVIGIPNLVNRTLVSGGNAPRR
jgi:hypothetical protein